MWGAPLAWLPSTAPKALRGAVDTEAGRQQSLHINAAVLAGGVIAIIVAQYAAARGYISTADA